MSSRTRVRRVAVTCLLAALTAATTVAAGLDRTPARAHGGPAPPAVSFGEQRTVPAGDGPIALGTGETDVAVANQASNDVSVLLGTGAGGLRPATSVPVGRAPSSIAVADLNRDRISDLVVGNRDSADVTVLLGTGTGSFVPTATLRAGASPRSIAVLDVDRDGRKDLAVANLDSDDVSVLLNTSERRGAGLAHRPRG